MTSLRQQVLRGGFFLAAQQAIGILLSAAGVLVLTRQIGPANYGLFVAALGIFTYFYFLGQFGLDVFLIRRQGPLDENDYHLGFTILLATGSVASLCGIAAVFAIQHWTHAPGFAPLALALFAGLPVSLLTLVPTARLERALDYRRLAIVQITGSALLHVVSVAAAFLDMQAWSPICGWWVQQAYVATLLFRVSHYRPRLFWNRPRAVVMMRYGVGYASSQSVWHARSLISPLLLLPWAGSAAVGYVGLASRLVDLLSLVRATSSRLALSAFARFSGDRRRSVAAVSEGMRLQVLGVAVPLAGCAILGQYVMPVLFQDRWTEWAPVLQVFPYLAVGALCNALFSLHTSLLYVFGRNALVGTFFIVYVTLLFAVAAYLVPSYGIVGVGLAEIAVLPSYLLAHIFLKRVAGVPDYTLPAVWALASGMLMFVPTFGWMASAGVVAAGLWPATWRALDTYVRMLRSQRPKVSPA